MARSRAHTSAKNQQSPLNSIKTNPISDKTYLNLLGGFLFWDCIMAWLATNNEVERSRFFQIGLIVILCPVVIVLNADFKNN